MAVTRTTTVRRYLIAVLAASLGAGFAAPAMGALDITMFTERDFVQVDGLASGDVVDVDLMRNGQQVGKAHDVHAVEDPANAGTFTVIVNHPGPPDVCWDQSTPDVIPGDVFRITVSAGPNQGVIEEATVADLSVTQAAAEDPPGSGIVSVKGTAAGRPPIADLEQRLTNPTNFTNGRRTLRAPAPDGTLVYDGPGDAWTATYAALGVGDLAKAIAAESRISRAVTLGGGGLGLTIFEFGGLGGPQIPGCPAQEIGPTITLSAVSDTGTSSTDHITRDARPVFTGSRGSLGTSFTVNLYDGPALAGTGTMALDGSFIIQPTAALSDGIHQMRAGHSVNGPNDVQGPIVLVRVDTTAPPAPFLSSTDPPVQGDTNAVTVRGTAEAGTVVRIYTSPGCGGIAVASGAATALTGGVPVTVSSNATTRFFATAEDVAGNVSACSAQALTFKEVSPTAAVVSPRIAIDARGRGRLGIRCSGLFGARCTGKVGLVVTIPPKRKGKKPKKLVIGTGVFNIVAGRTDQVRVTLSPFGRNLLATRGRMRITPTVVPGLGSAIGSASRKSVLLVAAPPPIA